MLETPYLCVRGAVVNASVPVPPSAAAAAYHVRTATLTDLSGLVNVLMDSFYPLNRLNRWLHPLLRVGINEDLKLRLKAYSRHYFCLAAIAADGQLVGTAEVSLRSPFPFLPQRAYVSNLAVSADHRRRGVAQLLLQNCESLARTWDHSQLYLHVAKDNTAAQQLYTKLNYHPIPSPLELALSGLGLTYHKQLRVKHL